MTALVSTVDRQVNQFGLLYSEASDTDVKNVHFPAARGLRSASTSGQPCKYHVIHYPQGFSGITYNTGWGTLPDYLRCSLQVMKE